MADLVTLDTLFGSDPAAADNSPADATSQGAASAQAASPPAGPDLTSRIADLEGLVQRHQGDMQRWREQVTGSQRENERLRTELNEVRTRLSATPPQAPAPPPRRVSLVEAQERFLLDNDKTLLQAYEQQQADLAQTAKDTVTIDDVRELLAETEQKRETRTQGEQTRHLLEQTLIEEHPELKNPTQHKEFINAVGVRYAELRARPASPAKYPKDDHAIFTDPSTGVEYDMRILIDAADLVRAQQPVRPAAPTLGSSGAPAPAAAKGPVLPRHLVEGPNAVLADPAMQKALANIGWGSTTKELATTLHKHTSAAAKQRWQRGETG